ncbi:MAG: ABC transporter ATP-binding protein [Candidatus Izemoplasmataceae bacterium]
MNNLNSIEVKGLKKTYKDFTLKDVTFSLPSGYIMGFIGENGAGKTTTINSMLNITKRESGSVRILGFDIDTDEFSIKRNIGFVSGESFYHKKKVKVVTDIYKRFYDDWDDDVYQSYLTRFNINPEKRIDELSKGMAMKYLLALALSHHAKLLILDEPTSGLDPVARDNLLEIFQTLVEELEVTILFSTHITSDLEKCADYITYIQNGQIVESSSKDDLIDKYRLVTGSKEDLVYIKETIISYKTNAFGFNGLINSRDVLNKGDLRYGQPSIDDIMVYFAEREATHE